MNIKKYFWSLNEKALKELGSILKNPQHPRYIQRTFTLLSRCDDPKEVFSVIKKEQFIKTWPDLRRYWAKTGQSLDFKAWWETVYEQLSERKRGKKMYRSRSLDEFMRIGKIIKQNRIENNISQADLARQAGMKQPDISAIEAGKKNITLETLMRLSKILGIKNITF